MNIDVQVNRLSVPPAIANFAASFGATIGQNGCAGPLPGDVALAIGIVCWTCYGTRRCRLRPASATKVTVMANQSPRLPVRTRNRARWRGCVLVLALFVFVSPLITWRDLGAQERTTEDRTLLVSCNRDSSYNWRANGIDRGDDAPHEQTVRRPGSEGRARGCQQTLPIRITAPSRSERHEIRPIQTRQIS
jgi:hypothetical protein